MSAFPNRTPNPYDVRMLSMAHRLFAEYDRLSVGSVVRAIARARATLRDQGSLVPDVRQVERLARELLGSRVAVVDYG